MTEDATPAVVIDLPRLPAIARDALSSMNRSMPSTLPASDLLDLPNPEFLIHGVMERNSLSVLYGPPGTGKSFVGLDLALHIATGRPWMGHEVRQGSVLYVAAEGHHSFGRRLRAWLDFYHMPVSALRYMYCATGPVPLMGGAQTLNAFMTECIGSMRGDEYEDDYDDEGDITGVRMHREAPEVELVIFDTLARCIAGADENDAKDMGQVIQWLDALRDPSFTHLHTSAMVIHHTSKMNIIERGSSVLRGAADTMMLLKKDNSGQPVLTCTKQKNSEEFIKKDLTINKLASGEALVIPRVMKQLYASEVNPVSAPKPKPVLIGARQKRFMAALSQYGPLVKTEGMSLTVIANLMKIPVPNAFKTRDSLVKLGYVYKNPETTFSILTDEGQKRLESENIWALNDVLDKEDEPLL